MPDDEDPDRECIGANGPASSDSAQDPVGETPIGVADGAGARRGCGRLDQESLEIAAAARVERGIELDERISTHLVICRACVEAVDQLQEENRLLLELARASMPKLPSVAPAEQAALEGGIPGYRLKDELHRGGQGAVYLAEQLATRRSCAVKMLLGGRFATPMQRARFEREVEIVAAMRHPAIVTLYESGISCRGEPWFAMEFVEGERLDAYAARVRPDPRAVADLMRRVADAMAYAHRRGVVHRDLKPGNILIDRDGAPRVLDFGLARSTVGAESSNPRSGSTIAGEFVGTFAYASPEQLSGDPAAIDSRCDLYALGVVFYEILTGTRPFEGAKSISELVAQKSAAPPHRPSAVARAAGRAIDSDLDVIILRLLAPDPARRYATAAALAEDLERFLDGRPILAREESRAYVISKTLRRHWLASSVAALFVLTVVGAAIALGVAYARAESEQRRVERAYAAFRAALASANPEEGEGASAMNVRDFLGLVEKEVRSELVDEPEVLGEMLQTVGLIQLGFEDPARSRNAILNAHQLIADGYLAGRVGDKQMASAEIALARQFFHDGDLDGAETSYRKAVELLQCASGATGVETVDAERQLATVLRRQKRYEEARAVLARALAATADFSDGRIAGDFADTAADKAARLVRAGVLNGQAALAVDEGDDRRAIDAFRETLAEISRFLPANDIRRGRTLTNLARAEFESGELDEAERHAEEAVRILLERKGPDAGWTKEAVKLFDAVRAARSAG